jgi:penicillin-binding protein 1A
MKTFVFHLIRKLLITIFIGLVVLFVGILYYIEFELPDIEALNTVQLQVPLQIFTHDGKLMAEYGEKRRIPLPFAQIPKALIDAVLATEDQRYFQHPGIDVPGLMRAALKLAVTGKKEEGGSTITMQVARSFYLTRHKTFGRKLREILLALKIDHRLSKQKILELYLNKIFLGSRAYGVAAAAEIYYGKPINQLSLDQYAMLAGLPKAPSALNPIIYPIAAKKRRDHVLYRMYELGYIQEKDYKAAVQAPLKATYHDLQTEIKAPYVAELVRQQLEQMYGDIIYTDGFNVYTTLDSNLQTTANTSIHDGLLIYDQRHGYRGPEQNLGTPSLNNLMSWKRKISAIPVVNTLEAAVVMEVADQSVLALRANGTMITVPWNGLSWARKQINADFLGRIPTTAQEILKPGDVIRIMPSSNSWRLSQIPKAEAGMVALNPQDGEILAMVGGFDFQNSNFNRITNALRQPGSSFKPFIYSAALDKGYTLATVINDAPIVIENPIDNTLWRPQNDTGRFYGPTRLREALAHSRNLVSIRLLGLIGTNYAVNYAQRFGFAASQLPPTLSLALGTASVTPLDMATGYAVFANQGFRITPYIIADIRNTAGQIIYQAKPLTACPTCPDDLAPMLMAALKEAQAADPKAPLPPKPPKDTTHAPRVISEQTAFLVTSTLHDVIQYGTATEARSLRRKDLAGKTGTTSNQIDAWFVGYNPDIVALTWVGFDQPQSLHEYGAQAALPIWIEFMQSALHNRPEHIIDTPPDIESLRVDASSGLRADDSDPNSIYELFMKPYTPSAERAHYESEGENGPENENENENENEAGVAGQQEAVSSSNQALPEGGGGIY